MDDVIQDLIEEIVLSGTKIYFAYELPDGSIATVTNGDLEFMGDLASNILGSKKLLQKQYDPKSKAQKTTDEGIAGNKGNVGDKGNPVPGYAHKYLDDIDDSEIEKKFTIN